MDIRTSGGYNRFFIRYCSDCPARGRISYRVGGEVRTEEFFLEAKADGAFDSFIDDYLSGELVEGVMGVEVKPLTPEGMCVIKSVRTETGEVFAKDTFFFENGRYRVGAELTWGGGLSYIKDKKCPGGTIENLLNHHDAGRLVQQSYYGIREAPYECGEFMGSRWGYNPVQGGDRGKFKSKLVSLDISDKSIYVKCQPRDWGHVGRLTPSYMENTYTLDGDLIYVDNRFVDFSGYIHPKCGQELPAFYTVSYLGNFWFYGGEKPWTDDALEVRRDLIFWPEDWPRHTFQIKDGNNETWCAWTDDGDFGIGLYVPAVTRFIAGRFSYNGSKDPAAGATNYVAPVRDVKLESYRPLEYSYLIAAGTLEDIRRIFKDNRDFSDNRLLSGYGE